MSTKRKTTSVGLFLALSLTLSGCTLFYDEPVLPPPYAELPYQQSEVEENAIPGTVREVWEEQMVDTVRVPAQLDPTGTYFIPSHYEVIEIRPGRNQLVEFPDDKKGGSR